jgi:hypothetical protein
MQEPKLTSDSLKEYQNKLKKIEKERENVHLLFVKYINDIKNKEKWKKYEDASNQLAKKVNNFNASFTKKPEAAQCRSWVGWAKIVSGFGLFLFGSRQLGAPLPFLRQVINLCSLVLLHLARDAHFSLMVAIKSIMGKLLL